MAKPKTSLKEPDLDNRLIDERGPTKERLIRAEYDIGDSGTLTIRESPVSRSIRSKTLNPQQRRAAEKLYAHWYGSGMAGTIGSADLNKIFGTASDFTRLYASESAQSHLQSYNNAIRVVRRDMDPAGQGMDAVRLLELIVLQEIPFEQAGQAVWPNAGQSKATTLAIDRVQKALRVLVIEWDL